MPTSYSTYFETLLESTRPFLRGEIESVDPNLPCLVSVPRSVDGGECWHKHGSFLDHLFTFTDPVCLLAEIDKQRLRVESLIAPSESDL
ncbi:hypothetical protein M5689_018787 [Euphorbia peplus]|nr:hypothetical protein M5689_018787 [Euphorbia peplus]